MTPFAAYLRQDSGELERTFITPLRQIGPWAVHVSVTKGLQGFTVSHAPSGGRVWPYKPGMYTLPQAVDIATKLNEAWNLNTAIPAAVQIRLRRIVGEDPAADDKTTCLPESEASKWLTRT